MDAYFFWTGVAVNVLGSIGVGCVVLLWSIDRFFAVTGLTKHILEWRVDKIKSKRTPG